MPEQACRALTLKLSVELPATVEGGSVMDTVAEVAVEDVMVALTGTAPLSQPRVRQSARYVEPSLTLHVIVEDPWTHG